MPRSDVPRDASSPEPVLSTPIPMPSPDPKPAADADPAPVILVHGLWMGGWMLTPLRLHLRAQGFDARPFAYASMRESLADNARRLAEFALSLGAPRLHFVGHSLGGLIVWRTLIDQAELPPGRAVLLGSPVLGSHAARRFAQHGLGQTLLGRSIRELIEGEVPAASPPRELGVIAGSLAIGLGQVVAPDLPRPNDGVVAVSETLVAGAADRIVLPLTHTALVIAGGAARQAGHFLRHGRFRHDAQRAT
jgi:pimeloyl-ACP methyl ester carboxylesterase